MGGQKVDAAISMPTACCLCNEISCGEFPAEYRTIYPVDSRICCKTQEFAVLPTLSPLREGHSLVLPLQHVTNLAALPEASHHRLLECVKATASRLSERFEEELYFFEHGVTGAGLACGIDHAHLHVLPLANSLRETVEMEIQADFHAHYSGGLIDVLSLAQRVKPTAYLLHGLGLDSLQVSFKDHIPSQYMRRLIAGTNRSSVWDWKLLTGREEFLSTLNALR